MLKHSASTHLLAFLARTGSVRPYGYAYESNLEYESTDFLHLACGERMRDPIRERGRGDSSARGRSLGGGLTKDAR